MSKLLKNAKKWISNTLKTLKYLGKERLKPSFLVIGTQKGGTTSLYNYLAQHSEVSMSLPQEVHYFDTNYHQGPSWYQKQFPPKTKNKQITGDVSPYYIFHPLVAERVKKDLPAVKIIALLRNPTSRAYSHYQMEKRKGRDPLPFLDAVKAEPSRLAGGKEELMKGKNSPNYRNYSYLERGKYASQLKEWQERFPAEQILVLKSEELFEAPRETLSKIYNFLGIAQQFPENLKSSNQGVYTDMDTEAQQYLNAYFQHFNEELFKTTGIRF